MRQSLIGLALLLAFAVATPAQGHDPDYRKEDPRDLALQGFEQIMRALDGFVRSIPQYAVPEITEDGDIIIRRLPPRTRPEPKPHKRPNLENREI